MLESEVRPEKKDFLDGMTVEQLLAHPVFGMWNNREETKDCAAYIRRIRRKIEKEILDARKART